MESEVMRHSAAHIMAAAVCRLFDGVKLDIGDATEDGFYFFYDFDLPKRLSHDDFPAIEKEMAAIVAADYPFERIVASRDDVKAILKSKNQTYKLERLADIPENQPVTLYKSGDFVDLCRGPHVASTGQVRAFRLISVAGSYYRGVETNPMLQRVYGVAAESEGILQEVLVKLEEARKRDHRKIGREQDLFSIEEDVGPGLVHWHPRGGRIRVLIEDFWRREHLASGYEILFTPHIGRAELWERSGHLGFYRENMYSPMDIDGRGYFVKPMNCPFHIQIYKSRKRSYRDLPLRWAELGTVYRYEKSGVLMGLLRVRGFTQDDAHIFCAPEQIEDEVRRTLAFGLRVLKAFGFSDVSAFLATRPDKSVGDEARWEQATSSLRKALEAEGVAYQVYEGGGAFYGPKIDVKIRDCLGRPWQMSTIQFDFNMPERFDLSFTGVDGREHRPYMVHRALLGSIERFFGILIEHYCGAFPLWLAPEQARVLPVSDEVKDYAAKLVERLSSEGFRVTSDRHSGSIGSKIRRAQEERLPYMIIVGRKERDAGTVSLRSRGGGDEGVVTIESLVKRLQLENRPAC